MAVTSIQSNTQTKKTGFINSTILGGLSGYALKWAIPITPQERDEDFYAEIKKIEARAKEAKRKEIEAIKNTKPKIQGSDEFINSLDKSTAKKPKELSWKATELLSRVNHKAELTREIGNNNLETLTKSIRPAGTFIMLGATVGLIYALLSNIANNKAQQEVCD